MKRLLVLFTCSAALVCGAELSGVRSVYVLTMARGLDQYLANRLTNDHVFQVVTDPKLADAFLTDQIGNSFQAKLEEIFPPPPEKAAEETEKEEDKTADKGKKKDSDDASLDNPLLSVAVNKVSNPAANSAFGRSKGTVFLVDAKSRQVLWSTFDPPKDISSRQLDRTASDIVSRLKKDLNPAKK